MAGLARWRERAKISLRFFAGAARRGAMQQRR
jgi:hypothetical protein